MAAMNEWERGRVRRASPPSGPMTESVTVGVTGRMIAGSGVESRALRRAATMVSGERAPFIIIMDMVPACAENERPR